VILLRRIGQNRPFVTLIVLCTLSTLSLVTGVESTIIHHAIKRAVAATAYPFLTGKNWVKESGSYFFDLLADFDAAQDKVALLGQEQTRLKQTQSRARELHNENARLRQMLQFTRQNPNLQLMPVNVIQTARGVLTIDRGALHGLQTSVGVIAPQGVVGIITEVSDFSASVATLHHADCKVGAMVLRNRLRAYDGIIHAGGSDLSRICTLQYIDMKDDVRVGDQIVTSAESLFPSGLPVGSISRVQQAEGLLKTAEVIPAVDPYQLDEVFVIVTADEKTDDLRGPTTAEPAIRNAAVRTEGGLALPDQKSMQERYAP
jgi:rod shape-determining protein MreC